MRNLKVFYKTEDGGKLPIKAHASDAGYDVYASSEPKIFGTFVDQSKTWASIDYIQYETNLFLEPDTGEDYTRFDLRPRSSISKYWLSMCNAPATIDHSYRGQLLIRFNYLWQPSDMTTTVIWGRGVNSITVNQDKIYRKGDRICQLLPEIVKSIEWSKVDELGQTARSDGGFGSTGK